MHIVCCVKQVPDTAQVKIDPETNTLVRTGVESICNPYDLVAVEQAVQLVGKYGGKVTVITMGPPQADSALRECLALGAQEAILLADRVFAGADTLATSYVLAQAVHKIASSEAVDLIICGKQAIDGDTAQVGPGLATRLGYDHFTYVSKIVEINSEEKTITLVREVEGGREKIKGYLPALVTAELDLATPGYASLPEFIRSLRQEIKVWHAVDIEAKPEMAGLKGSPTWVKEIFTPPARKGGPVFNYSNDKEKALDAFIDTFTEKERVRIAGILSTKG
jgi:electron transfer flavoprotein beta subunit